MTKDEYEELRRMIKEEFECLRKDGYLSAPGEILYANGIPIAIYDPVSPMDCRRKIEYSSADERPMLYYHDSPVNTFDPISPMICQSNQIAYNMVELANANFSALHTEQVARMDDIYTLFATPYNEAKIEGIMHVSLKTKYTIEDLLPKEDLETLRAIMWTSFVYGVVIPFCIMWLICDELLPFF